MKKAENFLGVANQLQTSHRIDAISTTSRTGPTAPDFEGAPSRLLLLCTHRGLPCLPSFIAKVYRPKTTGFATPTSASSDRLDQAQLTAGVKQVIRLLGGTGFTLSVLKGRTNQVERRKHSVAQPNRL